MLTVWLYRFTYHVTIRTKSKRSLWESPQGEGVFCRLWLSSPPGNSVTLALGYWLVHLSARDLHSDNKLTTAPGYGCKLQAYGDFYATNEALKTGSLLGRANLNRSCLNLCPMPYESLCVPIFSHPFVHPCWQLNSYQSATTKALFHPFSFPETRKENSPDSLGQIAVLFSFLRLVFFLLYIFLEGRCFPAACSQSAEKAQLLRKL